MTDLEIVASMDQAYMPYPWSLSSWMELPSHYELKIIKDKDEEILGFSLFEKGDPYHLLKLVVLPKARGTGIAEKLLDVPLPIYLEVRETNARAVSFYRRMNFKTLRRVPAYFSDGETALMMLKEF